MVRALCRIRGHNPVRVITGMEALGFGGFQITGTRHTCSRCSRTLVRARPHRRRGRGWKVVAGE